jgi:hypothetical protein
MYYDARSTNLSSLFGRYDSESISKWGPPEWFIILFNSDFKVNVSSSLPVVWTLLYLNFCLVNDVESMLEAGLRFIFKAGSSQSRLPASAETLNC